MNLQVTKERVLSAAAKCGTAKATLQELFPEAFELDLGEYPLKIGDVYKSDDGNCNDFQLVQAMYEPAYNTARTSKCWCLLGCPLGLGPNSNDFHKSLHTLAEIAEYLKKQKMHFSHNVRG